MGPLEAERRLALIAAATSVRREERRGAARRCATEIDWRHFTETLRRRRLLPLLGPPIADLSGEAAGEGFLEAVEQSLEAGRRQAALLQLTSLRAIGTLAAAGIRAAQLKGPGLGEAIYGDPGRRLSSDVDLLVPVEQLEDAAAAVQELGYAAPADPRGDDGLPQLHLALEHEKGELPPIELHWRIHWYERKFARERLLPAVADPTGAWRPEPAAELASLLLYYARDGFIDLRYPADLAAWWDSRGGDTRPGDLAGLIEAYPALAAPLATAAALSERLIGLPAADLVGEARGPSPRRRVAMALANPNPKTSTRQLYADCGLLDGLLAPPGSLGAWARRRLLPPPNVLDQQARHGQRERRRSRLGRCLGALARYGYRLLSLPFVRLRAASS